jgi:hypothetical protein
MDLLAVNDRCAGVIIKPDDSEHSLVFDYGSRTNGKGGSGPLGPSNPVYEVKFFGLTLEIHSSPSPLLFRA